MLATVMRVICLTHVPFEGPARIQSWAESRGHELRILRSDLSDELPEPSSFSMLVVMGGPMSVNDGFPWLRREAALVESCLQQGRPILGVCLGAQLLAQVLGARVFPSGIKEIGWWPVARVPDKVNGLPPLPHEFVPLHWHGETFELPRGATLLASSAPITHQAFVSNGNAVGVQFHVEATPESVAAIVDGARSDFDRGTWVQPERDLLAERDARCSALEKPCYDLLDWLIGGQAKP